MPELRRKDEHPTQSGLSVVVFDAAPGDREACSLGAAGLGAMSQVAKRQSVAAVRSALVFSRSAALAEYGGFPGLHYYVMEGRQPSAFQLLSDRDTRLAVGDALHNLAAACDRGAEPAKRSAGRKLRASRLELLDAFAPVASDFSRVP